MHYTLPTLGLKLPASQVVAMLIASHRDNCYLSRILGYHRIHIYFCETAWGSYPTPLFDLLKLPNKSLDKAMCRERALKPILMDRLSSHIPHRPQADYHPRDFFMLQRIHDSRQPRSGIHPVHLAQEFSNILPLQSPDTPSKIALQQSMSP